MSDIGHSLIIGDSQCKYFDRHIHLLKEGTTVISVSGLKIEDIDDDMLEACGYYDHVILHVGTNNMIEELPTSACAKYETLISSLRQMNPAILIFISGVLPRASSFFSDLKKKSKQEIAEINEKALEFNLALRQLCNKYESCYYMDAWNKFTAKRYLLSRDGLHLSKSGIKTILQNIIEAVKRVYSIQVSASVSANGNKILPVADSKSESSRIVLDSFPTNPNPSSGRFKSSVPTFFKSKLPQHFGLASKPKVAAPRASVPLSIHASPAQISHDDAYADAVVHGKIGNRLCTSSSVIPRTAPETSYTLPSKVIQKPFRTPSHTCHNKIPSFEPKNQLQKKILLTNSPVIPSVTAETPPQLITKTTQRSSTTISLKKNQFSQLYLLPNAPMPSSPSFSKKTNRAAGKRYINAIANKSSHAVSEIQKNADSKTCSEETLNFQYRVKLNSCFPSKFSNGLHQDKLRLIGGGKETSDEQAVDEPSSGEEYFKPKKSRSNMGDDKRSTPKDFVSVESIRLNKHGYKCETCSKIYKHKSSYYEHIKLCNKKTGEVVCQKCKVCYKNARTFSMHLDRCNPRSTRYTRCVFPKCHDKFYTRSQMVDHLENKHEQDAGVQRFMFDNFEQLDEWKKQQDRGNFMSTVQRAGSTTRGDISYHYYTCNFDVKRRKARGPGRIYNFRCPARILVREENGKLHVRYISGHSHDLQAKNLQYHQHSKETLDKIRAKFSEGVPPQKVLEQLHGPDDGVEKWPEKEHLIPRKTITDMLYRYNRSLRVHKDDATSVGIMADMLDEKDEILIYKPQNEKTVIGPTGIDDLEDSSSIFILGYQNERMRKELLAGSSRVLCVDATHSTNKYKFNLLNFIVPDEYGMGYPVAHFITSNLQKRTLEFIWKSIKEKLPTLKVNVLMTDDDDVTWPAFHKVFGGDTVHYLCTWHVDRALKKQLNCIVSNPELKNAIESDYRALIEEKDTNLFKSMLENFIKKYSDLQGTYESKPIVSEGDQKDSVGDKEKRDEEIANEKRNERDTKDQKETGNSMASAAEKEKQEKENARKEKQRIERDKKDAESYMKYFIKMYYNRPEKWAMCYRLRPHAETDTNMYVESFHNTLKGGLYLNRKVNGRIDNLIETLKRYEYWKSVELKRKRLYQEPALGLKKPDEIESRHTRGLKISDKKVTEISNDQWHVTSSKDPDDYYEVTLYNEYCPLADHCDQKCYSKSCILLCMHLYVCECADRHPLCKHKHKVHSLRIRKDPILANIKVEEEPADWKMQLQPEPKYPSSSVPTPPKMVADLNFLTDKLRSCFTEKAVQDKFYPRLKNILQQLICECEYAIKEERKKADPPPMSHDKIAPNKKAEKQRVVYRTTKERQKRKKNKVPRKTQPAKISVKNELLNIKTVKSTDQLRNDYKHDYYDLTRTLFSIEGVNLNLIELKTLDDRLDEDEVAALKVITRSPMNHDIFRFGWLTDSIIDAYTAILRREHPHILGIETFVCAKIMGTTKDYTEEEMNEHLVKRLHWLKFDQDMAFMPVNPSGIHWCLLVTDKKNKAFLFLNPMQSDEYFRKPRQSETPLRINSNGVLEECVFRSNEYQYFFDTYRMLLQNKTGVRPDEWKLIIPQHCHQKDGYNCGVFVCWFYKRLLAGESINVEFNPHEFRMEILRLLIREGNPKEPIDLNIPEL